MKKIIFALSFLLFIALNHAIQAQSLKGRYDFMPDQFRQYQFQLEEPVKSIDELRYEQTGEKIKGALSPDGLRVVMENYKKGQRVKLKIEHADGKVEEVSRVRVLFMR
ncbi:MAG: hypothetical protein IPK10_02365 [Bacteroidetes bacterium]|nr:hypothetical protein [Bacteroidota bacterium]